MASSSPSRTIPPLLDPYLTPLLQPASTREGEGEGEGGSDLVIATGILGASTNWLVLRYLYSVLKHNNGTHHKPSSSLRTPMHDLAAGNGAEEKEPSTKTTTTTTSVLLLSFLRDLAFWRENAGRIGLDLDALGRAGRFAYVDGLGVGLFHSDEAGSGAAAVGGGGGGGGGGGRAPPRPPVEGAAVPSPRASPVVPGRQPPAARGPVPTVGGRTPPASASGPGLGASGKGQTSQGNETLTSPGVTHIRKAISGAVEKLAARARTAGKKSRVVVVIDQLDFLLAAAGGGGDDVSALALRELLLDLRETVEVDTTILTLSADEPLIGAQTTTLEKEHANFVLSLAHEAAMVLSLRLLDTGVAKDVSGVIRITAGGDKLHGTTVEENEYLYHVRGDGSVRVFERGQ